MPSQPKKPFDLPLLSDVHWAAQDTHEYIEFSAEVESLLKESVARHERKIEDRLRQIPQEHRDDFVESEAWQQNKYREVFPVLHREATFMALYFYLEWQLNHICSQIGEQLAETVKLHDIGGKGFERAHTFLKKVPGFEFGRISREIAFLRDSGRLRNSIAHAGGLLPPDKDAKINKFVRSEDNLDGQPGSLVRISPEFIDLFAKRIRTYFEEVSNEMQRYMDIHVRGKQ